MAPLALARCRGGVDACFLGFPLSVRCPWAPPAASTWPVHLFAASLALLPVGSRVSFTTSERGLPRALGLRGGVFPAPSLETRQSGRRLAGASNGRSLSSIGIGPATAPSDDFQHADPTRPNQRLWQDHRAPTTSASLRVDPGGSQRHPRHPQATSAKLSIAHTPFELSL